MIKKRVERWDGFSIDIYGKKDRSAEVVVRKNKLLYRINAAGNFDRLAGEFEMAVSGVRNDKAKLIELHNSRGRRWVFEFSLVVEKATVQVWELLTGGTSVLKFNWQGDRGKINIFPSF